MLDQKINKLAITLGLLPLLGFADPCCDLIPGDPIQDNQVCPGYFYPALYNTNSCVDISVNADFIYWAPTKQLNAIAFENTIVPGVSAHTDVIIHRAGYRPGFKVGVGIGSPEFDHYVLNVEYFWYNHTTTTSRTAATGNFLTTLTGIVPRQFPQPVATHVSSKWRFYLQMAQLTAGRPFYLGKRLILEPSFGLKAFWFDEKQDIDFDLIGGTLGTERSHFKSWAVGAYANLDVRALLGCGAYVVGKFALLAPYQKHTKVQFLADFPFVANEQVDFDFAKKKLHTFEPYLETGLGLGWGSYFCNNGWHADIAITYDYFGSMFLFSTVIAGPMAKDHWMHGLTVRTQIDF